MKYTVAVYCPDKHIQYDIHTLDHVGVGGGITARIRIAHALAGLGHQVTAYVNCPKEGNIRGVNYHHFNRVDSIQASVLIVSTSGNGLDLRPLKNVDINAKLRILLVHGLDPPKDIDQLEIDYFYALSNFVRQHLINNWNVSPKQVFVTHRGVTDEFYRMSILRWRNPYRLIYAGHPSKGLEAARGIVRILRKTDPRFHLQIYGGYRLWGDGEKPIEAEPGIKYLGLIGQRKLTSRMQTGSFCINLQERQEPFGMVVIEAMRAECIVLASPVGAYPELIQHGINGLLIEGHHLSESTQYAAAQMLQELTYDPERSACIRSNARHTPLSWKTIAAVYDQHWKRVFGEPASIHGTGTTCHGCRQELVQYQDGLHCDECGIYLR